MTVDAITHVRDRAFNDRRYFICDKKLAALGWVERTSWEDGLHKTIEWFKTVGSNPLYFDNGDIDMALVAHPTLQTGLRPSFSFVSPSTE
jgi:UDP-glucose 4,6-dehydratase